MSYHYTVTGGYPPYAVSLASGALPPGLSLSTDGILSGTPLVDGDYSWRVQVVDSLSQFAYVDDSSTIAVPPALFITGDAPPGNVGTPYSFAYTPSGGVPGYTVSLDTGALPTGLTLSSSGVLSGTPTVGGPFAWRVKVTDSIGQIAYDVDSAAITEHTTLTGDAPDAELTFAYVYAYAVHGTATPITVALTAGALPTGLSIDSSGVVTGTPTATGDFSWTLTATDADGGTVTLSDSSHVYAAVLISGDAPDGHVGTVYTYAYAASLGKTPYAFAVATGTLPAGLTLASNGVLSGTPSTAGSFVWSVRVTDALGAVATISDSADVSGGVPGHLFWRLKLNTPTASATAYELREIQMLEVANGPNVAIGGTAYASSTLSTDYPASAAFMYGNMTLADQHNAWSSTAAGVEYLAYKFASAVNVTTLVIGAPRSDTVARSPGSFDVQYSDDSTDGINGTWTTAWSETNHTGWYPGELRRFTDPASVTYLWNDEFTSNTLPSYVQYGATLISWVIDPTGTGSIKANGSAVTGQDILIPRGKIITDGFIEVDVLSAGDGGLVGRVSPDGQSYYMLSFQDASTGSSSTYNKWNLYRKSPSTGFVSMGGGTLAWPSGSKRTARMEFDGPIIRVYFAGQELLEVSDTLLTSGGFGLRANYYDCTFEALRAGVKDVFYSSWIPDNGFSISNKGRNAKKTAATFIGDYSNIGHDSGAYYCEMILGGDSDASPFNGVGLTGLPVTALIGGAANSYSYYQQTGQKSNNNVFTAYGATYLANDVIGIGYNAGAGTIEFFKNKVSQGVAFTGVSGAMYPGANFYRTETAIALRTTSAEIGTIPAGYLPWAKTLILQGVAPVGGVSTPYSFAYTAAASDTPVSYAVTSGTLPPGLALSSIGVLSGTPLTAGAYTWTVTGTDHVGATATLSSTIHVGVFTTWNPSDAGAGIALSGGNLGVTNTGSSWAIVRSVHAVSHGKSYAEFTDNDGTSYGFGCGFGLASSAAPLGAELGNDANGWGLYGKRTDTGFPFMETNGSVTNYPTMANGVTGSVMKVAYDADAGKVWLGQDREWAGGGDPALGTSPTFTVTPNRVLYLAAAAQINRMTGILNAGATPLKWPVPVGFQAGWIDAP